MEVHSCPLKPYSYILYQYIEFQVTGSLPLFSEWGTGQLKTGHAALLPHISHVQMETLMLVH